MRYDDKDQESGNVEDRRGQGGGGGIFQGGGSGMPGGFKLPLPLLIIGGLIMFMLGINPLEIFGMGGGGAGGPAMPQMPRIERTTQGPNIPGLPGQRVPGDKTNDEMGLFISRVLKDTEDVWERVFQSFGKTYEKPRLVMFTRSTQTACGTGMSAMGPFYCPADRKVYVDLAFYEELRRRFKAPGDFAQAYVIAHEVGHHVQTLLGIADRVQQMKSRMSERQANQVQVRMELQADCLAGVWAALNHQMKNRMEQGDVEEGLNAATQIGDDMIQRQTQGTVVPESFTHGSSQQRVKWFRQGMATGQIQQCDTFNAPDL